MVVVVGVEASLQPLEDAVESQYDHREGEREHEPATVGFENHGVIWVICVICVVVDGGDHGWTWRFALGVIYRRIIHGAGITLALSSRIVTRFDSLAYR